MKSKTDLDILEDHIFEILKGWQTEHYNATVPTPVGEIRDAIMNEVKKLLFKLAKVTNK